MYAACMAHIFPYNLISSVGAGLGGFCGCFEGKCLLGVYASCKLARLGRLESAMLKAMLQTRARRGR